MEDPTTGQVTESAARVYERFFVPALFGQWPEQVLQIAGVTSGMRVLDVACGTGVLVARPCTGWGLPAPSPAST